MEPEWDEALAQVRRMRAVALERRVFRGYSGAARMLGGAAALAGAGALARLPAGAGPRAHLAGWAVVLMFALTLNYGGLLILFLRRRGQAGRLAALAPALDVLPSLALGAGLSLAAVRQGAHDLLFPLWMGCYGLAHLPYRNRLPVANLAVGWFYLVAAALCIVTAIPFSSPWIMGTVFGLGELAGGWALLETNRPVQQPDPASDDTPSEHNPP